MPAPSIDYIALLPYIIVGAAGVIGVIVEAFVGRSARRPIQLVLAFGSLIGAFVVLVVNRSMQGLEAEGALAVDGPGMLFMGLILLLAILVALLMSERQL
ncbi:MAG: hypothetical protein KGN38_09235, partial [Actinomycetales bacterium]|nr:hypothetical protein [Actinomycetales bacterium]